MGTLTIPRRDPVLAGLYSRGRGALFACVETTTAGDAEDGGDAHEGSGATVSPK